jgi:DNA-binding winged helix-turn-helix (wHTH) protein
VTYSFDKFELSVQFEPGCGEMIRILKYHGRVVQGLTRIHLKILELLIKNRGSSVTREEFRSFVWCGRALMPNTLHKTVGDLKNILKPLEANLIDRGYQHAYKLNQKMQVNVKEGGGRAIQPVLHTIPFTLKDGRLWERIDKLSQEPLEKQVDELTGVGDAEALRLLQEHCDCHRVSVKPALPAAHFQFEDDSGKNRLEDHDVFWIGNPFNRNHCLRDLLAKREDWISPLKCSFDSVRSEQRDKHRVRWPGHGKPMEIPSWGDSPFQAVLRS